MVDSRRGTVLRPFRSALGGRLAVENSVNNVLDTDPLSCPTNGFCLAWLCFGGQDFDPLRFLFPDRGCDSRLLPKPLAPGGKVN